MQKESGGNVVVGVGGVTVMVVVMTGGMMQLISGRGFVAVEFKEVEDVWLDTKVTFPFRFAIDDAVTFAGVVAVAVAVMVEFDTDMGQYVGWGGRR